MAAYPATNISRTSTIAPDAGIQAEPMDDGSINYQRNRAVPVYGLQIIHEWVTQAEFDAILDFIDTYGYGEHTFTLHGIDFTMTLINEPEISERRGSKYMVTAKAIAVKA